MPFYVNFQGAVVFLELKCKGPDMRSIGKVKIKKLKIIVIDAMAEPLVDRWTYPSTEEIMERVPTEWFDLWEGAHSEIYRIISDTRMNGA